MIKLFAAFVMTALMLAACNNNRQMQEQIDSLQKQVAESYKPGFGESMSNIQVHHAKLWFAGKSENWRLAEFEIHEITESLETIQKYQAERVETASLPMLTPGLAAVTAAIQQQNVDQFEQSYQQLTATCNACHVAVKYEFNVVKIPDQPPFSNQEFSARSK